MTQSNENGSRLDRIEAIMLELATASVRHDNAISRHDEEFSRINATLERVAQQQEANNQAIAQNQQAIAQLTAEQQLSRQDINTLTANIQELRNMVADYIQGRSET